MYSRILIVEYLHANDRAFANSSASMRAEGKAMLQALADDASKVPGVSVSVACCEEAATQLRLADGIGVFPVSGATVVEVAAALLANRAWDVVVPIAPECENTLADLVRTLRDELQTERRGGRNVLADSDATLQTCSDKWQTHQFLIENDLPTIESMLLPKIESTTLKDSELCVVKPRDGAGCEGIVRLPVAEAKQQACLPNAASMIVQPWLKAESFSVAMIGNGANTPPSVFPVATQQIEWKDDRPCYRGGEILPSTPAKVTTDIGQLCRTLATGLRFDSGYLGVDLLMPEGSSELLVTEINPRICTSYIGYRKATASNLFERLLQGRDSEPIRWSKMSVKFECETSG